MAINIFSGSSGRKSSVNSASRSSRAQAARAALGNQPAEVSDSGSTAVGTNNTLSKIGNTVGKVAGIASKFLPGVGGVVAKGIANLFNDPEWWQSVPGEQITTNVPLRIVSTGDYGEVDGAGVPVQTVRPAIVESVSLRLDEERNRVMHITPTMVTQYLMPEIRKAVNAVPLQAAEAYSSVLSNAATVYALWRNLKRYDYLLKHGQTYIPNLNSELYPVLQVENAAWLQSTINRLEEYLRANVRIPHTLCCYLAWRYGRVYKMTNSAKAGLVLHNVLPLTTAIATYNSFISDLMTEVASTDSLQKANTDVYNSYFDHDMMVEIADHTQFSYDMKEWALRTNMDIGPLGENVDSIPVYIDSNMDNTTTFMASTVSTYGLDPSGARVALFPVHQIAFHVYADKYYSNLLTTGTREYSYVPGWNVILFTNPVTVAAADTPAAVLKFLNYAMLLKATDTYNKGLYYRISQSNTNEADETYSTVMFDVSSPSLDMGTVSGLVLGNEHTFAFANLVSVARKRSAGIAQANKTAASEVANVVEKLDIATAATPTTMK